MVTDVLCPGCGTIKANGRLSLCVDCGNQRRRAKGRNDNRDSDIVDYYLAHPETPMRELAAAYGISLARVQQIIAGVIPNVRAYREAQQLKLRQALHAQCKTRDEYCERAGISIHGYESMVDRGERAQRLPTQKQYERDRIAQAVADFRHAGVKPQQIIKSLGLSREQYYDRYYRAKALNLL